MIQLTTIAAAITAVDAHDRQHHSTDDHTTAIMLIILLFVSTIAMGFVHVGNKNAMVYYDDWKPRMREVKRSVLLFVFLICAGCGTFSTTYEASLGITTGSTTLSFLNDAKHPWETQLCGMQLRSDNMLTTTTDQLTNQSGFCNVAYLRGFCNTGFCNYTNTHTTHRSTTSTSQC